MTRAMFRGWISWVLAGVMLSAFSGCGETEGGDGNSGGFCERFSVKLTQCGMSALLDDVSNECDEPREDELCEARCVVNASCDDLTDLFCGSDSESALDSCLEGCQPPPFECGSGETIDDSYRCNGYEECSDGSDEVIDCPTCGNGEPYYEWERCDGYMNCSDGADEEGCPTFRCANGELVPEDSECNFYPQCSDGSDEHGGCPSFECENGETLPAYVECDGYADCADYSDEPSNCPPSAEEQICGTM